MPDLESYECHIAEGTGRARANVDTVLLFGRPVPFGARMQAACLSYLAQHVW